MRHLDHHYTHFHLPPSNYCHSFAPRFHLWQPWYVPGSIGCSHTILTNLVRKPIPTIVTLLPGSRYVFPSFFFLSIILTWYHCRQQPFSCTVPFPVGLCFLVWYALIFLPLTLQRELNITHSDFLWFNCHLVFALSRGLFPSGTELPVPRVWQRVEL